jgi:hypothetical protein
VCVVRDITCNREEGTKSETVTARPSDKDRLQRTVLVRHRGQKLSIWLIFFFISIFVTDSIFKNFRTSKFWAQILGILLNGDNCYRVSVTETKGLLLFTELMAVYCDNRTLTR